MTRRRTRPAPTRNTAAYEVGAALWGPHPPGHAMPSPEGGGGGGGGGGLADEVAAGTTKTP